MENWEVLAEVRTGEELRILSLKSNILPFSPPVIVEFPSYCDECLDYHINMIQNFLRDKPMPMHVRDLSEEVHRTRRLVQYWHYSRGC